jgi:hypothetical protein
MMNKYTCYIQEAFQKGKRIYITFKKVDTLKLLTEEKQDTIYQVIDRWNDLDYTQDPKHIKWVFTLVEDEHQYTTYKTLVIDQLQKHLTTYKKAHTTHFKRLFISELAATNAEAFTGIETTLSAYIRESFDSNVTLDHCALFAASHYLDMLILAKRI